jgi:lipoprotein-releasing system permease protein
MDATGLKNMSSIADSLDKTTETTVPGPKPFAPYEWMLSGRYLRARRKEGFISVIAGFSFLGIMLGVATLIIVMSVMNGFRAQLLDKILGLNGHVIVHSLAGPFTDYKSVVATAIKLDRVKQAIPLVEGQAMISTPARSVAALVRGISEQDTKNLNALQEDAAAIARGDKGKKIIQGTLDGFDNNTPSVAIGSRMSKTLNTFVGDYVTLVSPRGASTPFGTAPRIKRYQVTAVFEIGMSEYDSSIVFMPLAEAQKFFNRRNRVDAVEIVIDNADAVGEVIPVLRKRLGETHSFADWRDRNKGFFTALEVERSMMFIILSLIVLVAALNIISGLIMLVKDKSRDIAVLRTMGATKGSIMRIFFITGASIGIVGTLAGFVLGVLFVGNIEVIRQFVGWLIGVDMFSSELYYLTEMPAEMDWREVLQVVAMALVLSMLATVYPAWRAAKMDPVEALRYE